MMTDESIMPFGKYKGDKMANVPVGYLLWLHKEGKYYGTGGAMVKEYIERNLDDLKQEYRMMGVPKNRNLSE